MISSVDSKGEIKSATPLDIPRHQGYATTHLMAIMESQVEMKKAKKKAAYPLRFRSDAQKKRLQNAAKRVHKTLRDFLLDLGEAAANGSNELRAS